MQQGISNPEFYGDLVYEFKKIIGNPNFSDLFKSIVKRFKKARFTAYIKKTYQYLGWGREIIFLLSMWFLFGGVSSSSGSLGWAALTYSGTP